MNNVNVIGSHSAGIRAGGIGVKDDGYRWMHDRDIALLFYVTF